eukprot:CAMPEP_0204362218 /NCGR_PEP_ID=MMETSP0469-20131031/39432_1 /ASSEMBLY_ACC=CAM_ASM_000384 /TAXON_ID=2969 /ORGANISM="Oxyrrhis marina" /LENGTH=134 /DNA_ID=CAMNT_0051350755 /DNA_START=599 /DNA_END=1003 /DNA_ORIENTATION=-
MRTVKGCCAMLEHDIPNLAMYVSQHLLLDFRDLKANGHSQHQGQERKRKRQSCKACVQDQQALSAPRILETIVLRWRECALYREAKTDGQHQSGYHHQVVQTGAPHGKFVPHFFTNSVQDIDSQCLDTDEIASL